MTKKSKMSEMVDMKKFMELGSENVYVKHLKKSLRDSAIIVVPSVIAFIYFIESNCNLDPYMLAGVVPLGMVLSEANRLLKGLYREHLKK